LAHHELLAATSLFAMGCMGMRHALDPDHVATVDGLTFGVLERSPRVAPLVGPLFALGHGLVVTLIAASVAVVGTHAPLPASAGAVVAWTPMALLLLVGGLNLHALLKPQDQDQAFTPVSWKAGFLPKSLRESSHPLMVLMIGVIFALMLDSVVAAAAWGLAAAASGGVPAALGAGLAFTGGMVLTAGLYGAAMVKLVTMAQGTAHAARARRAIGWFTVVLAIGIVAYAVGAHLFPAFAIDEETFEWLGLPLVGAFGLGWAGLWVAERRGRRDSPVAEPAAGAKATPGAAPRRRLRAIAMNLR